MKQYRFAICDDEAEGRTRLEGYVRNWAKAREAGASVNSYVSAEAFLFCWEEKKDFDILLLDVEMGGMTGIDLARVIRAENKEIQIIFITGYMEYIADGYEVEALNYLIKPVAEERLYTVLDRATERLRLNDNALLLNLGGESVRVPLYEVRYIDVQRNYVTIHGCESYTIKTTLRDLEKSLDSRFFRAGRSCVINLLFIRKVARSEVFLTDGTSIPLPKGLYGALNQAIIERL